MSNVSEKFIIVNNNKIRYFEGRANGPNLVLIHGLWASAERWFPLLPYLEQQYHLIIPDIIGFGYSDKPVIDYSVDFFVEFFHDLMKSLKMRNFHVIGSSFGGQVAAEYAIRFSDNIQKMILCAPSGVNPRLSTIMNEYLLAMISPNRERITKVFQMMTGSKKPVDSNMIDDFISRMTEPNSKFVVTSVLLNLKKSMIADNLHKISCPCLVVWGDKDQVISPRYAKIFASLITNCDLVMMKGCGHTPFVEQPKKFSEITCGFLN